MGSPNPGSKHLGARHRHYNEEVKEAIANNHTEINFGNRDLNNLVQIDIASHNRNVEYILDILKSDDVLFVSRAIKKCMWLLTDSTYADIIDPDYLNIHLYPKMTSKAKHKLHKHIRNNIKVETTAEKFYHAEDSIDDALKWLPKCSVSFIESKIMEHHNRIKKTRLFKRICERSVKVLNLIEDDCISKDKIEAAKCLQKKDITVLLNAIERMPSYVKLNLNKKTTTLLMRYCPDVIIEHFGKYYKYLDIATFAKYLKPESVKEFIYKQASLMDNCQSRFVFHTERFHQFLQRIPKEERFEFVSQVFIKQVHKAQQADTLPDAEIAKMQNLYKHFNCPKYVWYRYAPFKVAFSEIKQCSSRDLYDFLIFLIKNFGQNQSHLQSVLKYYLNKHNNESNDHKIRFVDDLLVKSNLWYYDDESWSILNEIFKSLNVYSYTDDAVCKYIEVVIVHKLIKSEPIPEQLQEKFIFTNTFIKYSTKLNANEKIRVFEFIFNYVLQQTNLNNINNKGDFESAVKSMKSVLDVLNDWTKELFDYPSVLQKITSLVRIKREQNWNSDLSLLYNVKKSWKKLMFEESLILEPSEKVCINALKHDPELLRRYEDEVEYLLCDCKLYLGRFLRKVHIYCSDSIVKAFINKNLLRLEHSNDHNIVTRNLGALMEHEEYLKVVQKYKPKTAKINWEEEDGLLLSVRRHIAKNMHFTRPHPPPDVILAYAKGDYLQYAVPSILAIFHNMNTSVFRENVPKLFNSPVSLQKLGIRLAVSKLHNVDLVTEFHNLWTNTKNTSIRSIIFQLTFKLLCRQKNDCKVKELWNLLEMFIDNLTFKEDKAIYSLMYKTNDVPQKIKASFIEKNHTFLESYLAQTDTFVDKMERYYMEETLILKSIDVMEKMNEDFIVRVLDKFINEKFFCKSPHSKRPRQRFLNPCNRIISVLSVYLLCAKDEQKQETKYKSILLPILKRALGKLKEEYRWLENIQSLLDCLRVDLNQYALKNDMVIPLKMFSDINDELVTSLNIPEYYVLLTQWKLTVEYVRHLKRTSLDGNNKTDGVYLQAELFGKKCLEILKKDIENHFPRIYLIFHKVLNETLKDICTDHEIIKVYTNILSDKDFIPGYVTVLKIVALFYEKDEAWDELLSTLEAHPSTEVKMHYSYYFKENRYFT